MFKNRLEKNWKKVKGWVQQQNIQAYRLYDRDIPEIPYIVDRYKNFFVIYDRTDSFLDQGKNLVPEIRSALRELFDAQDETIILKERSRQPGFQQYEKLQETHQTIAIEEGPARFLVNLWDYLDTGLFLDHRPMRQKIYKSVKGKRFLNLFCYTGSVSVCAALGGAQTTSVDMSATYLEWAQENFKLNKISLTHHQFLRQDITQWLRDEQDVGKFDVVFLDPPTFSNSKKMSESFDVERDQDFLLTRTMRLVETGGVLYFSNNKRRFRLSDRISTSFSVQDITAQTIPRDFHDQKIHQCYEIRHLQ